jgi:hypothetical protein
VSVIPPLVAHCRWCSAWRRKCPDCEQTFANGRWQRDLGYPMHYATAHLGIDPFRRRGSAP